MNGAGSTSRRAAGERPDAVAVVIPAKDEAARIVDTVRGAIALRRVDLVVVVDDGSSDDTARLAESVGAVVTRHDRNRGKAAAMATGAEVVARLERVDAAMTGRSGARALLFLDADMGSTAREAAPLVDAVLDGSADMAIATLPRQAGAAGMGIVVRTSRAGIERATGWSPVQPLSGTRCMTRAAWEACQPLAAGWGVETSLTIDALRAGLNVVEVPCDLRHRATGKDLRGQMHRAAQLRDVVRALATRVGPLAR